MVLPQGLPATRPTRYTAASAASARSADAPGGPPPRPGRVHDVLRRGVEVGGDVAQGSDAECDAGQGPAGIGHRGPSTASSENRPAPRKSSISTPARSASGRSQLPLNRTY